MLAAQPAVPTGNGNPPPASGPVVYPPPSLAPIRPSCPADSILPNSFPQFETLCLVVRDGRLFIRIFPRDAAFSVSFRPLEASEVLTLAASVRARNVWPKIEAYLGPNGQSLRAAIRLQARRVVEQGCSFTDRCGMTVAENQTRGNITVILRAASLLNRAGDSSDALALLESNVPRPQMNGAIAPDDEYGWQAIKLRIATTLVIRGEFTRAEAKLRALETAGLSDSRLQLNAMVTHAGLLAELHRASDALALATEAERRFQSESKGVAVRGSNRHFAWIKACALQQLGKSTEAKSELREVRSEFRSMNDQFGIADESQAIQLRAALCMNDDEWLARLLQDDKAGLGAPGALIFQTARQWRYPGQAETVGRAESRLRTMGKLSEFRQLPADMAGAVNSWSVDERGTSAR